MTEEAEDWTPDQWMVVDEAYDMGWTLERLLGAADAIIKKPLMDADRSDCDDMLTYLYEMKAADEVARLEHEADAREDR